MVLTANLLFAQGLGPRLVDLLEIQCGGTVWTAYLTTHCDGPTPSSEECEAGLNAIRELERTGVVRITNTNGYQHMDFRCPDCNGNALMDRKAGRFQYVDFQNFLLVDYGAFLQKVAREAAKETHFGNHSYLRGGAFLYQSVPGLNLPARRDAEARGRLLDELMQAAGVAVKERLVLDIGCNVGMMTAQYLKRGAYWTHGWDAETVIRHAERLMLGVGCTRFSLTPGWLEAGRDLVGDLPAFLVPKLRGCVISYLSIRRHVGWLDALKQIPWDFMIYEGHEAEDERALAGCVAELGKSVPISIGPTANHADGDSLPRVIAVLINSARAGGGRGKTA
jgi:hypothetical protein